MDDKKQKNKDKRIYIRVAEAQKNKWKKICLEKKISLTELIINSIENKNFSNEKRQILNFIEKQDNIFSKIENNINQFAKIANTKKDISDYELKIFNDALKQIQELKKQQNLIIFKIYKFLADDN